MMSSSAAKQHPFVLGQPLDEKYGHTTQPRIVRRGAQFGGKTIRALSALERAEAPAACHVKPSQPSLSTTEYSVGLRGTAVADGVNRA